MITAQRLYTSKTDRAWFVPVLPVSLVTELSCLDFLAGAIHLHLILLRILTFVEFECHHYN